MKKNPDMNHLELLPKKGDSVSNAFEVLVERYPLYHEKGLFRSPIFMQQFADRWSYILDNLPKDRLLQRAITMEFSYMVSEILYGFDINVEEYIKRIKNTVNKIFSFGEIDPVVFQRFQTEGLLADDLNNMEVVIRYLNFLFIEAQKGIYQARSYIEFCVAISQLHNGFPVLKNHIEHQLYSLNNQDIATLEEMNTYLGHETIEGYTQKIVARDDVSYLEATHVVRSEQSYIASLHAFINSFYESKIRPHILSLSIQERYKLSLLLNDFRDILDPRQRIPDSFQTQYPLEQIERDAILYRGRNLH